MFLAASLVERSAFVSVKCIKIAAFCSMLLASPVLFFMESPAAIAHFLTRTSIRYLLKFSIRYLLKFSDTYWQTSSSVGVLLGAYYLFNKLSVYQIFFANHSQRFQPLYIFLVLFSLWPLPVIPNVVFQEILICSHCMQNFTSIT